MVNSGASSWNHLEFYHYIFRSNLLCGMTPCVPPADKLYWLHFTVVNKKFQTTRTFYKKKEEEGEEEEEEEEERRKKIKATGF